MNKDKKYRERLKQREAEDKTLAFKNRLNNAERQRRYRERKKQNDTTRT